MSLRRVRRRRRATITSLIDVIFLLLLFFMLASTFSRFSEVELTASAEGAAPSRAEDVRRLTIAAASLELDGGEIKLTELRARLAESGGETPILLAVAAQEDVTTQRLIDILTGLRGVPDLKIHVLEPT